VRNYTPQKSAGNPAGGEAETLGMDGISGSFTDWFWEITGENCKTAGADDVAGADGFGFGEIDPAQGSDGWHDFNLIGSWTQHHIQFGFKIPYVLLDFI
jgi:hypothetical protein